MVIFLERWVQYVIKINPTCSFYSLHALLRIPHVIQMCGSHYIFSSLGVASEPDP